MTIRIAATGTAVPTHVVSQDQVRAIVEEVFASRGTPIGHLANVFDHHHIQQRFFVRPPRWYATERTFEEANAVYVQEAVALASAAATKALDRFPCALGGLVVVSSTGITTPSLDAAIIRNLNLGLNCVRVPVFGLGCAAGVSGLARAAELSRGRGGLPVMLIAVEICSVTFRHSDPRPSNIVGSSIFADGAAAVIVSADGTGPAIIAGHSTLFPETEDIMGWDVKDDGLHVRFSRDIPSFVREHIPSTFADAMRLWRRNPSDVGAIIAHPGGAKVLEALSVALNVPIDRFPHALDVLRDHGNMSSASVLFVLDRWLESLEPHNKLPQSHTVMSALGPGFSSEMLLLES